MNKYAIRFWPFTTLDYKAAEKYLEEKAQKGLILVGLDINSFPIAIYKKEQPTNVKYCIDGFKHSKYTDKGVYEYNSYLDMAKTSGWNHVCEINYMQYFVSDSNAKPVPLQTALETEFEAMKKPYRTFELPFTLIMLFALIFMNNITNGEIVEMALQGISMISFMLMGCAVLLIGLFRYLFFILRGSKAIGRRGENLTKNRFIIKVWGYFYNAVLLFMFGSITILAPYEIIFRDYVKSGNKIALYFGIAVVIGICLMKISNTATVIIKEKEKFWSKVGNFGCGVMLIFLISAFLFVF